MTVWRFTVPVVFTADLTADFVTADFFAVDFFLDFTDDKFACLAVFLVGFLAALLGISAGFPKSYPQIAPQIGAIRAVVCSVKART